jgi:hypothetical protein
MPDKNQPDDALQGEGNYDAAEKFDRDAREFANSGKVEKAARDAEPDNAGQERELEEAEAEGLSHARGGESDH